VELQTQVGTIKETKSIGWAVIGPDGCILTEICSSEIEARDSFLIALPVAGGPDWDGFEEDGCKIIQVHRIEKNE